jgi:DNA-binding IclR family transcriptional regulator
MEDSVSNKTSAGASPRVTPDDAAPERPNYAAPAVEKALDILEYLSEQAVPMTRAQLARALNRQPAELFRMLTCLENRNYLRRDPASNAYALTLKLFELSRTHSPYEELLRVAVPFMRELAGELRESCHLCVLHDNQVMVIAQEESPKPFRLSVEVGSLHPLASTTSGRILLAYMDAPARDATLALDPAQRRGSAADRRATLARLDAIREAGYECIDSESFDGAVDYGVLVGSPSSHVKAALVMATLRRQGKAPLPGQVVPALQRCAERIGATAGILRRGPAS